MTVLDQFSDLKVAWSPMLFAAFISESLMMIGSGFGLSSLLFIGNLSFQKSSQEWK
jgi:hypothetical protein